MINQTLLSRLYSETLGRAPDQGGWFAWSNTPLSNSDAIRGFYHSAEFTQAKLSDSAKIETLYRSVLGREADFAGKNHWLAYLKQTKNFDNVINGFIGSSEFQAIDFSKSFNAAKVTPFSMEWMSEDYLQTLLCAAKPGDIVKLKPQTLVSVDHTLSLPPGVTLETEGDPGHFAEMARFIRTSNFDAPMIQMQSGSNLNHVWVSGYASIFEKTRSGHNLEIVPGVGTSAIANRLDGSTGYTNIWLPGASNYRSNGITGKDLKVLNNFIVGDENSYTDLTRVCDGISIGAEDALVTGNQILNATDGGIVAFAFQGYSNPQHSQIHHNTIANTINSAYGALITDPFFAEPYGSLGDPEFFASRSFNGMEMSQNLLWTSNQAHFNVALSVGTRLWFGEKSYNGAGGVFEGNTTGILSANVMYGTIVSGALDVSVMKNNFRLDFISTPVPYGFDFSGYATGDFDYLYESVNSNFFGALQTDPRVARATAKPLPQWLAGDPTQTSYRPQINGSAGQTSSSSSSSGSVKTSPDSSLVSPLSRPLTSSLNKGVKIIERPPSSPASVNTPASSTPIQPPSSSPMPLSKS